MDFSTKPIKDSVVNSPPPGGSRIAAVHSPSPLRSLSIPSGPSSHGYNPSQRKLCKGNDYPIDEYRVCISYFGFSFLITSLPVLNPKLKKLVELPLVPLSKLSNHLSLEGVLKTKNHDVLPPLWCSPPVWDA